jgi:hypothetical protein
VLSLVHLYECNSSGGNATHTRANRLSVLPVRTSYLDW